MTSPKYFRKRGLEQVVSSLNLRPEDLEMIGRIANLENDPNENNNIFEKDLEIKEELKQKLLDWINRKSSIS